ncbi:MULTISPECIES: tRNA pseudouridine(55) synthase TruB [unclassified Eikenella]|uniref:tRNA pseudouridine(55) synthase TruB n=1 Tax=unclassified Eikenella TaxID=2639367 RepID=UPI0008A1CB16|nr:MULTISPECIES: tRNA pseudouridine(55) synthase TruB [unclassified Eikenella]OFK85202.1 pseudouridine synthase [Eikenella sp. HMSC071B05]OFO43630.1 pseudouridine synthase [Eikenella sp. HMSC073A11]
MKPQKRPLDGVLLLDKATGLSSNSALQQARRLYRAEKAGHTGVLDPLATGLLPICFGQATKFAQYLLDADKAYFATLRLGQATDTGDAEGSITVTSHTEISQAEFQVACQQHLGAHQQLPPMYSALKHQGKPLYQYARQGIDIQRQPRNIHIHDIQILRFQFPEAQISVQCSKGTYIRTLAEDIAKSAHTLAHLTALRRTATAGFQIERSHSIESLAAITEEQRDALLLPCDALVQHLPQHTASEQTIRALRFGQTPAAPPELPENTPLRIYAANREFIGLVTSQQGYLKALRLMSTQAD